MFKKYTIIKHTTKKIIIKHVSVAREHIPLLHVGHDVTGKLLHVGLH